MHTLLHRESGRTPPIPVFNTNTWSTSRWVVLKFGGTSVATAEGWSRIDHIVNRHQADGSRVLVVCSALAGVTNRLEALVADLDADRPTAPALAALTEVHAALARDLELDCDVIAPSLDDLDTLGRRVASTPRPVAPRDRAAIMAFGEVLSTRLGTAYLHARGVRAAWLDAREILRAVGDADRPERYLSARCEAAFDLTARDHLEGLDAPVVITQGFIARGTDGATVLLGRGGSDASAAYLAATIGARALEIWSDVPGMFTADPRAIPSARLLRRLSFGEAEALGALGAKVLHPRTIEPARAAGIPIRLGWTARPDVAGTHIVATRQPRGAKAVVSRQNLLLLAMRRPSSWQPIGFMAEVARRFHAHGLSMDLIASSPSEIRATLDLAAFPSAAADLERLLADLGEVCEPRVVARVACVSIAGAGVSRELARSARGAAIFADAAIHLVSHAANGTHVSVVVDERDVGRLVAALHERLVAPRDDDATFGPSWTSLSAVTEVGSS